LLLVVFKYFVDEQFFARGKFVELPFQALRGTRLKVHGALWKNRLWPEGRISGYQQQRKSARAWYFTGDFYRWRC